MNNGVLFLALAILSEVFGTTMLKLSEGFTILLPVIALIIAFTVSFLFLVMSLKTIPLSNAYAVWSGLGTALTAGVGVVLFREDLSVLKVVALVLIIAGVVLLNHSKDEEESVDVHFS